MEEKNIILSKDNRTNILKSLKDLRFATSNLQEYIDKNMLTDDFANTLVGLIEFHMLDITKILNINNDSAEKIEKRHEEIAKANDEIRKLKEQIGKKSSVSDLKHQVKYVCEVIYDWWRVKGFRHISEANITDNGIYNAQFFFNFNKSRFFSSTPESDKENFNKWIEDLKKEGYVLNKEDDRNIYMVDCDINREKIIKLLKEVFPSCVIYKWDNYYIHGNKDYQLNYCEVYIYDLNELKNIEKYKIED